MARYFTLIRNHNYIDKNQLHSTLKQVGKSYSNQVIPDDQQLEDFIEVFLENVAEAHSEHPRCKTVEQSVDDVTIPDSEENDCHMIIRLYGVLNLMIYKVSEND